MKNIEFFKKENLKDGMMLKIRYDYSDEKWYLKLSDKLIYLDGYNNLSDYTDDLKWVYRDFEKFDIIEIGVLKNNIFSIEDIFDPYNIRIIASRDEFKDEMIRDKISKLEKRINELKEELGE